MKRIQTQVVFRRNPDEKELVLARKRKRSDEMAVTVASDEDFNSQWRQLLPMTLGHVAYRGCHGDAWHFHIILEKSSSRVANLLVYKRSDSPRVAFGLGQLSLSLVGSQKEFRLLRSVGPGCRPGFVSGLGLSNQTQLFLKAMLGWVGRYLGLALSTTGLINPFKVWSTSLN